MRRHQRKKVFVSVVKIETGVWVWLGTGGVEVWARIYIVKMN